MRYTCTENGSQRDSSWYAPQHHRRDGHGPHHNILSQSGVSRPEAKEAKEDQHPFAPRAAVICKQCHKTFTATKGTVFYRLRTAAELVVIVVTWLAHGCPLQAIVAAFCPTRGRWRIDGPAPAGRARPSKRIWSSNPVTWDNVQADEIRAKTQGGIVWMALAMMV